MNPASNIPNQGTSINFDAQALHDAEEAEYQREEAERQNELRQLLTCAFDCDLSEEEDSLEENTSQTTSSHNVSQHQADEGDPLDDEAENWQNEGQFTANQQAFILGGGVSLGAHSSTPVNGLAPPLATPAPPRYPFVDQQQDPYIGQNGPQEFEGHQLIQRPYIGGMEANQGYMIPQQQDVMMPERGEIEGGNANDNMPHQMHHPHYTGNYQGYHYQRPDIYDGQEADPKQQQQQPPQPHQYPADHYPTHDIGPTSQPWTSVPQPTELHSPRAALHQKQQYPNKDLPSSPRSPPMQYQYPNKELENFKVQYTGTTRGDISTDSISESDLGSTLPRPNTPGDDSQRDFLAMEGSADARQYGQLEILYRARGNKIEELITELKHVKDDSDREIRILKHKITLTEGERDGLRNSLEQNQNLLQEGKTIEQTLHHNVSELEQQLATLATQKQQLLEKLNTAETSIENLNMQLMDIGSSETLSRVREQHEDTVSQIKQKHDAEILTLKQQLDILTADNQEKLETVTDLQKEVSNLTRDLGISRVDQAETVNKLTRSLEESQRQNRDLLDADGLGNRSVGQEVGKLKMQVQEAIAAKSVAEDVNSALQDDIKELKEQLTMYESASQFGITTVNSTVRNEATAATSSHLDDSYAQLGIRKNNENSTQEVQSSTTVTDSETVHDLKKELERCLTMYKGKREQLTEVQSELKNLKGSMEENKHKLEKTEKELQETKVKLSLREMSRSGASSLKEVRLQKEIDKVLNEKENIRIETEDKLDGYVKASECGANSLKEARLQLDLKKLYQEKEATVLQVEELRSRVDEISANEEKLTEVNRELQSQMAQMVKEFDEDKRQAVEKCRETCLQHHEDTKEKIKEDLLTEHQKEVEEIRQTHQEELDKLREDIKGTQDELNEVKELYVSVCQAKDELEEKLNIEWEDKLQKQINQIQEDLKQGQVTEIEELKQTLSSEYQLTLATQRERWEKEQEVELSRTVEEKIAESRVTWLQEHQDEKQLAVDSAVISAVERTQQEDEQRWSEILEEERSKWMEEAEEEADHKLQEARLKWQTDKRVSFERELQERLKTAKDTWNATELPHILEEEQSKWNRDLLGDYTLEEKLNKVVGDAKKEWRLKEKKHRDHSENKIRELSKLVVDVEAKVEKANWELKQELNQTKSDKKNIEVQLADLEEEKQRLIREKDEERRKAVKEAQEQAEKDYKVFLTEHQDTLNKALKSARQQFDREKEDINNTHEEEINNLKKKLEDELSSNKKITEEKESSEINWQEKVDNMVQQHREDRENLIATHRENLHQALEDARSRWSQQQESVLADRDSLLQKEQDWEEERSRYQGELLRLEQLLQSADEHMEIEIAKLHDELKEAHEKEIHVKLDKAVGKVEVDLQEKLNVVSQEKVHLTTKLEDTRSLLKELEAKYKKDTANLAEKARAYKHDLQTTRKELEQKWQAQEGVESQKDEISHKLKEALRQLEKSEKMRLEIAESYKRLEVEHAQIVDSYKIRQTEMNEVIQALEKQVKEGQVETQKQLIIMQESLEREQTAALEKMKTKLSEMRASHKVTLETARKEYGTEKQKLQMEIDALQNQRRSMTNTPTQTEMNTSTVFNDAALEEVKKHYIRAVTKMKKDVIKHVKNSNELAGETVKIEVLKERQKTAKRLRKYYMSCLSDLLDKDCDRSSKEQKMQAMEFALDNLPDSRATSRTVTPSLSEHTPRNQMISGSMPHTPILPRTQSRERSHDINDRTPNSQASSRSTHSRTSVSGRHSLEKSNHRSRSEDRKSAGVTPVASSSRHKDISRHAQGSSYYNKDSGGSTSATITPCETPIEDVIRRVKAVRNEQLAQNSRHRTGHRHHHHHQQHRSHSSTRYTSGVDTRDILRSRSNNNLGDYMNNSQQSQASLQSKDSQESISNFKNRVTTDVTGGFRPPRNDHNKRTSFGSVTKYSTNTQKHPSEPDIFRKVNSQQSSEAAYRERKLYDASILSLDSCCAGGDSMIDARSLDNGGNRSGDSSISGYIASAPASPPKSTTRSGRNSGSSYKYTSLRNSRTSGGFSTLSKAMSTSNITDRKDRSSLSRDVYNVPDSLFGDIPSYNSNRNKKQVNSPPEKDANSGQSTPTSLAQFITATESTDKLQSRHEENGAPPLRKPTPKKASSRSSSESRLPRPQLDLNQYSNSNNNNVSTDIQSTGSSFEKYSPTRETLDVRQGSLMGHTYTLSAEKEDKRSNSRNYNEPKQKSSAAGASTISETEVGVRLSWENPPSAYNLTLYSNKQR